MDTRALPARITLSVRLSKKKNLKKDLVKIKKFF